MLLRHSAPGRGNAADRHRCTRLPTPPHAGTVAAGTGASAARRSRGALRVLAFREQETRQQDKNDDQSKTHVKEKAGSAAAAAAAAAGRRPQTRSHFPPVGRGGWEAADVSGRREDEGE